MAYFPKNASQRSLSGTNLPEPGKPRRASSGADDSRRFQQRLDTVKNSTSGNEAGKRISGSRRNDVLFGGSGNDRISGGRGNDVILAGAGNDVIRGGKGNDVILGGAGRDTAVINGKRSDYKLITNGPVTILVGNGEQDVLVNVEQIRFSDQTVNVGKDDIATTLAIGEEDGDTSAGQDPGLEPSLPWPGPGDLTTLAIGEEGGDTPPPNDPGLTPPQAPPPGPGDATTLAIGEEGGDTPPPNDPGLTPPQGPQPGEVTTLAIGEEGGQA